MSNAQPSDMMSLAKIDRKGLLSDHVHVECNSSTYYFASGAKFGVKYKGNEELTYFKGLPQNVMQV